MNQQEIVREIIDAGRRLDRLGFVPATDGNISVRMSAREIVATVTGVRKGSLTAKDCVVIDPDGAVIRGAARPSSEILMHLAIYRARPDAMAVVHAHPPTATGFAVAGVPLSDCVLPEVVATIGAVPIAPYATPSTERLPESIEPLIADHDAVLLANHGAVTFAPDLFQALNRMETVEQFAKILFVARTLGQVQLLSGAQVDEINAIRHRYGFSGRAPACAPGTGVPEAAPPRPETACERDSPPPDDIVDRVTRAVVRILQERSAK